MSNFTTWRSLVDGEELSAIPDSAISQYVSPQFTSSGWPDNISDKDITTISGLTNDETAFGGEEAVVGDGTDDHGAGDVWDHWDNMHQDLSFGVSINTSDANGAIVGVEIPELTERQFFTVEIGEGRTSQFSDAGKPNIFFRDGANGDEYAVGTDVVRVDDGEDTHIGFSKTGNTGSDGIRIYINGSEVDVNVTVDEGFASGGGGDLADFNEEIAYFAHFDHDVNVVTDHIDAKIHEIVTYDEALSESEWADEFNRQPWS